MNPTYTIKLRTLFIVALILLIIVGGGFNFLSSRLKKVNTELAEEVNLKNALQDTLTLTKNKYGEVVSEKKTLQADIKTLEDENLNLTKNQKKLIDRVKEVEKENTVISAALIETRAELDSILFTNVDVLVNNADSSLTFKEKTDHISFDITVYKAIPASLKIKPTIGFNSLIIPNEQFIEFHWEDDSKYKQKPVSFTITNSNPFVTTVDADSYIIPEINKNALKPTGWKKIGNFVVDNKGKIIWGAIGVGIGTFIGVTQF